MYFLVPDIQTIYNVRMGKLKFTGVLLSISFMLNVLLLGWMLLRRSTTPPPIPQPAANTTQPTVDPRVAQKQNVLSTPITMPTATLTLPPRTADLLFTSSGLALAFRYSGEVEIREDDGRIWIEYLAESQEDFDIRAFHASLGKTENTQRETPLEYAKRTVCESQSPYIDRVHYCLESIKKTQRPYRHSTNAISGIQFEYNPGELPVYYALFEKNEAIYDITISGAETGSPVPEYGKKTINTILSTLKFL